MWFADALPHSGEVNQFKEICFCASCPVVFNVFSESSVANAKLINFLPIINPKKVRAVMSIEKSLMAKNKFIKQMRLP